MVTTGITTTSDGVDIAWDRQGSGDPLVLVHGITDNRRTWGDIAERFAPGHDVISIDVRGHGDSARSDDYGVQRLGADVAEVCLGLGLDRPVLVGHSLGGMLVTGAAAAVGARAVVNVDQGLNLAAMSELVASIAPQLQDPATFHATLAVVFSALDSPGLDLTTKAELDHAVAQADQDVVLGIWGPMLGGPDPAIDALVDEVLGQVRSPYLALHGIDPGPEYPDWLRQRIPQAVIEVQDGAGHFLHLVDPEGFVARVEAFLSGISGQ